MSVFRPTAEEKADIATLKEAQRRLDENSARERRVGIRDETPEYVRLNHQVEEAAKKVSRWRGGLR